MMQTDPTPPSAAPASRLRHTLTPSLVGLIAIGGVIGAGLFIGSAASLRAAGPMVLPLYVLAGLLMMAQMRMLAEMAIADPQAGSFIGQTRAALGLRAGFVAGWAYVLFWGATAGSEVIAAGPLFAQLTGAPAWYGAVGVLVLTGANNLVSARAYARTEATLSLVKLAAIAGFVLIGLVAAATGAPGGPRAGRLAAEGWAPEGWFAALAILPILIQTLTGFEIATVAAVESIDPVRAVRAASRSLVLRVGLFHVVGLAMVLAIVPRTQIVVGQSPFATALARLHIGAAAQILTAVVLVAVASCLNSALYAASRVLFELAGTADAPAAFGRLDRSGVPVGAVACAVGLAVAVALLGLVSPQAGYVIALSLAATLIIVTYILAGFAQIRRRTNGGRVVPGMAMWGFPLLSWLTIAAFAAVLLSLLATASGRLDLGLGALALLVLWRLSGRHRTT